MAPKKMPPMLDYRRRWGEDGRRIIPIYVFTAWKRLVWRRKKQKMWFKALERMRIASSTADLDLPAPALKIVVSFVLDYGSPFQF